MAYQHPQVNTRGLAARVSPNIVQNDVLNMRRGAAAPEAFVQRVIIGGQQYLRARAGVPAHVPASYLADLWQAHVNVEQETAWLAEHITPVNVHQLVELLIDPALDWYQQEYYKMDGYWHLQVPRPSDVPGLYGRFPATVTALYRRDANLMICARVIDDFLGMLVLTGGSFVSLSLVDDDREWRALATLFDAAYDAMVGKILPMLKAEVA